MAVVRTATSLTDLREAPRRVLAVFAHPDDEAYGCAGALARAGADADAASVLLTITRGEASSMGPRRGLSPEEVGDLRERRLEEVASVLALDGLIVADLPDGRLARLDLEALAAPVREVVDAFEPHIVITHDARGVNGHPDHIAVHWGVRRALADRPGTRLAMVAYTEETCEAAKPRLLFPTKQTDIDVVLALTEAEIDAKEACLRIHEGIVTLREDATGELGVRPPVECYDILGATSTQLRDDLFP